MTDINTHVDRRFVGLADECPAVVELAAHRADPNPEIACHVQECPRCRALLRTLPAEHLEQPQPHVDLPPAEVPKRSTPLGTLVAGELVTVSSDSAPDSLLVVLVLGIEANAARVIPVTASADLAGEESVGVPLPAKTPLGYEAVVDLGCIGWVDLSQVEERFGAITDELLVQVKDALTQSAPAAPVTLDVGQLREEASGFFLANLGELYRDAEASAPDLERELQSVGWTSESVGALRASGIVRTSVSPEQMATLFRLAGWGSVDARVERDTAISALRLAVADRRASPTGRSKAVAAMAFLAQVPGIPKRPLTADEYVDAVIRALHETAT